MDAFNVEEVKDDDESVSIQRIDKETKSSCDINIKVNLKMKR